ncbi:MAG TPA: right-handed parallel beta-helix repeat-containing protein [Candidatus Dojkabacteria bacterium]|nr:right-handed parallel beta-helix repeat-containing protein [Candidatus Dojkabacteria bacterium]HRP51685.1 right-handed parallel beta-helix repeat-containing protein [Candidatus Dojkabacteria bacterium]
MEKNIVLIDNNFAIRETLKIVLDNLAKNNDLKFNLYTSQNGIEGLGFVYVTHPEIIIVDTTLPKYSGNELLYFLLTNKKFHTSKVKVFVLVEKSQKIRVPDNFSVLNKSSKNFVKSLVKELSDVLKIDNKVNYKYPKLTTWIIKTANDLDVVKQRFEKNDLLSKLINLFVIGFKELLLSFLLLINYVFNKRVVDSNVKQERRNLSLLRRKHYPTAIAGSIGIVMTTILTLSVLFSQNIFFNQVNEETEAFGFGAVGWYSTMDNASDISNPVVGSAGEALNGVDYVTQNIVVDEDYSYDIISARFNADNEVVRIANPVVGEDVKLDKGTIEFMYSPLEAHTTNKEMTFFSIFGDANNKIEFKKLNDANDSLSLLYKCAYCGDAEVLISGANYAFAADDWVYFTVHWNAYAPINEQLLIYVNEEELPMTRNSSSINPASITDPAYIYIGNSSPTGTNEANGRIDDFTIYHDVAQPEATPVGTPAPTPVFWQNSGQASWYSTFDSMEAVTTPAIGDVPGVFSGASFIDGPAEYESALYFDGAGKSLYIEGTQGIHYSLNEGAVEFYYRPIYEANHNAEINLFSIRQNDNEEIRLYKRDNANGNALAFSYHCQTSCGGEETIALANYDSYWNDGEWMFFRITWNDNPTLSLSEQLKIFIDGDQPTHTDQEFKILGDNITSEPNPLRVYVGNRTENGDYSALGSIDEYRMFTTTVIPTPTITPTPSLTLTPTITPSPSVAPTATPTPLWYSTIDSVSAIQTPVRGSSATISGNYVFLSGSPYSPGGASNKAVKFGWKSTGSRIISNVPDAEVNETSGRISFHFSPEFASTDADNGNYFQLYSNSTNRITFKKKGLNLELHYYATAHGATNYNLMTIPNSSFSWNGGEWIFFDIYYNTALDQNNELRLFMSTNGGPLIEPEHTHLNTVTTPITDVSTLYIAGDPTYINSYPRGRIDDFRVYGYTVNMPTPTVPAVSPTPSPVPAMSILWYSTMANPTAIWQPIIGTTPTAVNNLSYATDGLPEARSGAVFNSNGSSVTIDIQGQDYDKFQGKVEFWYKPNVAYTQPNDLTFFYLRTRATDTITLVKDASADYLEFQYDSSCVGTGGTCNNAGTGLIDNRRTRYDDTGTGNYTNYWVIGKWMKFSAQWDYYAPTEEEKLKLLITYHNGTAWETVEPGSKSVLQVMNPYNFENAVGFSFGSNYQFGATYIRGNLSDFQIWGIGAGLTPTPSPTPVSLTSADPIWYSTMNDVAALTTPVIGKGATAQNLTFVSGVTSNSAKIDANSEYAAVGAIPYSTPPVSFKKNMGAIEFYYKPDLSASAAQNITLFNVRVDASNQLRLYKQSGSSPLWLQYTHGGSTKSIQVPYASFSPYWNIGNWTKIRAEWDRTKSTPDDLKLFLDNERPTPTKTGAVFSDMVGNPTLYIGNLHNTGTEPAMGAIDDFTIFGDPDARRYVVNSTLDESDADIGDLDCYTASGKCTLRAAIQEANSTTNADKIIFNIPGTGPHTISLSSALPTITNSLQIDGTTQTGSDCTTKDLRIVLSGNNLSSPGLAFSSTTGGIVKGLVIHGFSRGINYTSSTGGTVQCNIIGLAQDGVTIVGNSESGITLESNSTGNTIGGSVAGQGNILSGNYIGLDINSSNTNVVQGNYIGTNKGGEYSRGNTTAGIEIDNSSSIEIGDADLNSLPASCTGVCNVISGNGASGINYIAGTSGSNDNVIEGNYIGADKTGANQVTNYDGIKVTKVSNLNISYNQIVAVNSGIYALSTTTGAISGITVDNNYIGINRAGNAKLMDSTYGVVLFSSNGSTFSTATVTNNIIIGAVRGAGIYGYGSPISGISIKSNYIGTTSTDANLGNKYGIQFISPVATNNVIGGTNPADGNTIARNSSYGIYLSGTKNSLIRENTIRNNASDGISIVGNSSSENNTIIENSIYDNTGMGINLRTSTVDKVSFNDKGDTDSTLAGDGPNNLQNFPVLTKASYVGTTLSVYGGFQSESGKYYRLDFYSSASSDDTGFGEGANHIHTEISRAGSPTYDFSITPKVITSLTLPPGHKYISATATECGQLACTTLLSTSEFGLTGFDGVVSGKGLDLDTTTSILPKFYVAADGTEYIPDIYSFDILIDNSLDLVTGLNSVNMSPLGIVGLDNNNFATAGYSATNQYHVYNNIEGLQCSYSIGSNIKATDIKIAKNGVGSEYVYITSDSTNEELTLMQGEALPSGYAKYGEYLSEVKDMGTPIKYYHSIVWDEAKNGGEIKIQIRSGSSSNLSNEEWYGPDGTRGTFFTLSGTNEGYVLPKVIQGKQFIQYRLLIESDQLQSPALNSITIRYGT